MFVAPDLYNADRSGGRQEQEGNPVSFESLTGGLPVADVSAKTHENKESSLEIYAGDAIFTGLPK